MKAAHALHRAAHAPVRCRHRVGFALIEFLVVLFLTGAVLGIAIASVFILAPKLNRAAVGQLARLGSVTDTAEQFRSDVAGAIHVAEQAGPYRAGGDTLILRVGGDAAQGPTHLVWHWDGSDLWRVRWDEKMPKYGRLGAEEAFGGVTFDVDAERDKARVTMQLEARGEVRPRGMRARPARLQVVGVLGVDRE